MITLTVALPAAGLLPATEFDYALSDGGRGLVGHGRAAVALLPAAANLVLVVPARCLSWQSAKLPPVSSSRLRLALDGILEDRLLDEPANLALAVGPQRTAQGDALVAVCDKTWLRSVLEFFESAKRPATRVVPQFAPSGDDVSLRRLVVSGTPDEPELAVVDAHCVLTGPLVMAAALQAAALQGAGLNEGGSYTLYADPAVAGLAEQVLAQPATILPPAQGLAQSSETRWELAQFDLAISSSGRVARRWAQAWSEFARAPAWRPVRWGVVLLLLANLAGLNAWAWRQDAAVAGRQQQVKGLLSQTFPKVKTIVDAPLQMERELARLRQASGAQSGRDLEVMLGAVGAALPSDRNATMIEYGPGELALKGLALDAAQLALMSNKLTGWAYTARLEGDRLLVRAEVLK